MKRSVCIFLAFLFFVCSFATYAAAKTTQVSGYFRQNGTYVKPYVRETSDFGSSTYKSNPTPSYKSYSTPSTPIFDNNDDIVPVKGYTKSDGTYVRPHYRSAPDEVKWNNFGSPSNKQKDEWENEPILPSYKNDYDNDTIPNRYDKDDNNNGILDDNETKPSKINNFWDD